MSIKTSFINLCSDLKNIEAYECGDYEEYFQAADSLQLLAEEAATYSKSPYHLEDVEASIWCARMFADKDARTEALAEGPEEDQLIEKRNTARKLLDLDCSVEMIIGVTGLFAYEINKLR